MKKTKNKIDELINIREVLVLKRQECLDAMHEQNSKIETKTKKLENLSYRIKVATDSQVAEIDREIKKTQRLIDLERDYVNSVAEENCSPILNRDLTNQEK